MKNNVPTTKKMIEVIDSKVESINNMFPNAHWKKNLCNLVAECLAVVENNQEQVLTSIDKAMTEKPEKLDMSYMRGCFDTIAIEKAITKCVRSQLLQQQ